jgi:transcriptional regulator with XRE-family HTH domain
MLLRPDHDIGEDICGALRAWRIRSRLRQDAIAKCLGVAQSQVSRWESGRDLPRPHNVEAIKRLIRGPEVDPLVALRHFVVHSGQHLLLIDDQMEIIARSRPFQTSPNQLDQFGWVFDPEKNPQYAPVKRRCRELLRDPAGVVGLSITVPFLTAGVRWVASIGMTIHSIAGVRVCLCEVSFSPAREEHVDIRIEEVRLDPVGETRRSVTLWQQPHLV